MVAQTVGAGMGSDDGLRTVFQHVPETVGGNVGYVHGHSQPVHLCYHLTSELGETALAALFVHTVGNIVTVAPHQRHAADAQFIIDAKHFDAAI